MICKHAGCTEDEARRIERMSSWFSSDMHTDENAIIEVTKSKHSEFLTENGKNLEKTWRHSLSDPYIYIYIMVRLIKIPHSYTLNVNACSLSS